MGGRTSDGISHGGRTERGRLVSEPGVGPRRQSQSSAASSSAKIASLPVLGVALCGGDTWRGAVRDFAETRFGAR